MSATLRHMPKEQVEIHLRYEGPDVDDGTMSVQDIVPVLQGFSSAYGKLAATDDPSATHRVRIAAVRPGSADIVLEVWKTMGENVDSLTAASIVVGGAYWIISKIAGVVQVKRHVKKQPFKERISANNTIVISNSDNVTIEVPLEVYELFKSGILDTDLNKMTSPLVKGRIDAAEIEARSVDGIVLNERITVEERPYFETTDVTVTTTRETWLTAKLNSLTKTTDSGWLYLSDGSRAFYRYKGDNPSQLHQLFGNYDGPVRVRCTANLDENLKIVSMDVSDIEKLQGEFEFSEFEPSPEDDSQT
jgi:hypothetical protein